MIWIHQTITGPVVENRKKDDRTQCNKVMFSFLKRSLSEGEILTSVYGAQRQTSGDVWILLKKSIRFKKLRYKVGITTGELDINRNLDKDIRTDTNAGQSLMETLLKELCVARIMKGRMKCNSGLSSFITEKSAKPSCQNGHSLEQCGLHIIMYCSLLATLFGLSL